MSGAFLKSDEGVHYAPIISSVAMLSALEQFTGTPIGSVRSLGWFGISADPPTLAHRTVVDAVLGSGMVEKLVVFPTGYLPYKTLVASEWQRAEMTELWKAAAEFGDEVLISRFDLLQQKALFWIDIWDDITRRAPKIQHFLVVGSDQYREVGKTWYRGQELLERASFIVVPRKGFPVENLADKSVLLKVPPLEGSSTRVRAGDLGQVDERVRAYILEQKLY